MKRLFLTAGFSAGLLYTLPVPAQAAFGEIFQKSATVNLQEATSDDFLVELGRSADVNVVADVTEPPVDDPPITLSGKKTLRELVDAFVATRHTLATSPDERSLLFWPAPNHAELVKMIQAEQANAPKPVVAPLSPEEAPKRWEEYFRRSHNWDGNWQGVDIKVALDDLPADLRSQVQQEVDRRLSETRRHDVYQRRASDEFWEKARLYISGLNPSAKPPGWPHVILWDFTQTPFPGRFKTSTGINVVLGPLPGQVRR